MYIRTKDGIYETSQTISVDFKECYIEAYDTQLERWIKKNIINQSDNLEELCDNIVYNGYLYQNKITWDNCIVEDSFEELEEPITDEMIKDGIYGAIWTSKGLIYVAKMDSEGKLVLI